MAQPIYDVPWFNQVHPAYHPDQGNSVERLGFPDCNHLLDASLSDTSDPPNYPNCTHPTPSLQIQAAPPDHDEGPGVSILRLTRRQTGGFGLPFPVRGVLSQYNLNCIEGCLGLTSARSPLTMRAGRIVDLIVIQSSVEILPGIGELAQQRAHASGGSSMKILRCVVKCVSYGYESLRCSAAHRFGPSFNPLGQVPKLPQS